MILEKLDEPGYYNICTEDKIDLDFIQDILKKPPEDFKRFVVFSKDDKRDFEPMILVLSKDYKDYCYSKIKVNKTTYFFIRRSGGENNG